MSAAPRKIREPVLFAILFISLWAVQLEAQLPQSYSIRSNFDQWMPVVRNQGNRNACDAFTIAGIMEYERHAKGGNAVMLSPEFLEWAAGQSEHDVRDRRGYSTIMLLKAINKYGICAEALMPYGHVKWPNNEMLADARSRSHITTTWLTKSCEYAAVGKGLTQQEIDNICGAICQGHPVLVDMQWPVKPHFINHVLHLSSGPQHCGRSHDDRRRLR